MGTKTVAGVLRICGKKDSFYSTAKYTHEDVLERFFQSHVGMRYTFFFNLEQQIQYTVLEND